MELEEKLDKSKMNRKQKQNHQNFYNPLKIIKSTNLDFSTDTDSSLVALYERRNKNIQQKYF